MNDYEIALEILKTSWKEIIHEKRNQSSKYSTEKIAVDAFNYIFSNLSTKPDKC